MMLGQIFDTVLTVSGHEVDVIIDVYSLDDEYVDDGYEVSTRQPIGDNDDLDYQEVEDWQINSVTSITEEIKLVLCP